MSIDPIFQIVRVRYIFPFAFISQKNTQIHIRPCAEINIFIQITAMPRHNQIVLFANSSQPLPKFVQHRCYYWCVVESVLANTQFSKTSLGQIKLRWFYVALKLFLNYPRRKVNQNRTKILEKFTKFIDIFELRSNYCSHRVFLDTIPYSVVVLMENKTLQNQHKLNIHTFFSLWI